MRRFWITLAVSSVLLSGIATLGYAIAGRDALWQVTKNLCVRGQQGTGVPFPCYYVDLKLGFALLKVEGSHLLLIPTARIEGLESPELLSSEAPNFWEYAWEARDRLDKTTGALLSREQVGLAVNSAQSRTQDQLHIHIGCIRPDVRMALRAHEAEFRDTWSRLPVVLAKHKYQIMRIVGDTLQANPFKLLAEGIPAARDDMGSQTIVVIGARFRDGRSGFYVLADHSASKYAATGESLLDYQCSVSRAGR